MAEVVLHGIRSLELAGGFLGGMAGGAAGTKGAQAGSRLMSPKPAIVPKSPSSPFLPKKIGELEKGVVPSTPKLEAARDAAKLDTGHSAAGHPDLPDDAAQTFGPGVRPWDGDADPGTLRRIIDADSNPAGSILAKIRSNQRGGVARRFRSQKRLEW